MLQKRINKRLEVINAAQIIQLRKVYTSLRDGMSKIEDWFDVSLVAANNLTNAIKGDTPTQPAPVKQPEPQATPAHQANIIDGVDQVTGEVVEPETSTEVERTTEDWNIITDIINLVEEAKTKKRINKAQADSYDTAIADNFAGFTSNSLVSTKNHLATLIK